MYSTRDGICILNNGFGPHTVAIDEASICGDIRILKQPLLVESLSMFSSARVNSCVWKGKWMYEVILETSGVQQLGWATFSCPFTDHKGVGDAEDSYTFDGRRVTKWNKDAETYGQSWVIGHVIGCCINLDHDEISFYRNGVSLGVAFDVVHKMEPGLGILLEGFFLFKLLRRPSPLPLVAMFITAVGASICREAASTSVEKLRRLKRFSPLDDLFHPISHVICEELFSAIDMEAGHSEYIGWGPFVSFLMEIFGKRAPHDYERVLSRKGPNKQDLQYLIPSVWWPGSCEDVSHEGSVMMTTTALSEAVTKIEEMHRELCRLVIQFIPPIAPPQLPGVTYVDGLKTCKRARADVGFLHKVGEQSFPLSLFAKNDPQRSDIARLGGSFTHLLKAHPLDDEEREVIRWEEGCVDNEEAHVTHSSRQKPCCCSSSDVDFLSISSNQIRYSAKGSRVHKNSIPERSAHVSTDCSNGSLNDEIVDKPSSSDQADSEFNYRLVQHLRSVPRASHLTSETLVEEELLDAMLLLYHLGLAPNLKQASYYVSHQSQSISLLEETNKQIKDKSSSEQVRRLKEARNVYREEMVDCGLELQQRKCSVVFYLLCNLARVLIFCTREIPQAFPSGSDTNLRRLTELIVFILNHITSAADTEFFYIMECAVTVHCGIQYLLEYNWDEALVWAKTVSDVVSQF
ncbi:hypothetical protein IFM89_005247 [Coptis chinensis]|uniref:B30.2/SPRY domain-containing protein n=1 Tax=Coptis chinensis TaxID=261450 RepID=A0A835M8Z8_9MAGN|nr:hypothetical protein IFM89_005247 [Coptis chinensis]